jgi:hypothetical protein
LLPSGISHFTLNVRQVAQAVPRFLRGGDASRWRVPATSTAIRILSLIQEEPKKFIPILAFVAAIVVLSTSEGLGGLAWPAFSGRGSGGSIGWFLLVRPLALGGILPALLDETVDALLKVLVVEGRKRQQKHVY